MCQYRLISWILSSLLRVGRTWRILQQWHKCRQLSVTRGWPIGLQTPSPSPWNVANNIYILLPNWLTQEHDLPSSTGNVTLIDPPPPSPWNVANNISIFLPNWLTQEHALPSSTRRVALIAPPPLPLFPNDDPSRIRKSFLATPLPVTKKLSWFRNVCFLFSFGLEFYARERFVTKKGQRNE